MTVEITPGIGQTVVSGGRSVTAFRPLAATQIIAVGASEVSTTAMPAGVNAIRVNPSEGARVNIGAVATATSMLLNTDVIEYFSITVGEIASVIQP